MCCLNHFFNTEKESQHNSKSGHFQNYTLNDATTISNECTLELQTDNRDRSSMYMAAADRVLNPLKLHDLYKPQPGCGRDSSVGIATRYGLDGTGIESR
jgi:hypothetical protein